ncbi:MAG: hypothetical protein VX228_01365 [Pseudomonadota bacterium]|jgi:hypothetical protein|nr:hypothetical protein [Pseudomonadota bacterium]
MTKPAPPTANARGLHLDLEAFSEVAFRELRDHPLHTPGICALPYCSKPFAPSREWQIYCSSACRDRDRRDLRAFGEKIAPAQLAYRVGKYEAEDPARIALARAGRRYVGAASTALLQARISASEEARARHE